MQCVIFSLVEARVVDVIMQLMNGTGWLSGSGCSGLQVASAFG
jgi:hypothetical protein